jgi:hypothetical protein
MGCTSRKVELATNFCIETLFIEKYDFTLEVVRIYG